MRIADNHCAIAYNLPDPEAERSVAAEPRMKGEDTEYGGQTAAGLLGPM